MGAHSCCPSAITAAVVWGPPGGACGAPGRVNWCGRGHKGVRAGAHSMLASRARAARMQAQEWGHGWRVIHKRERGRGREDVGRCCWHGRKRGALNASVFPRRSRSRSRSRRCRRRRRRRCRAAAAPPVLSTNERCLERAGVPALFLAQGGRKRGGSGTRAGRAAGGEGMR